MTSKTLAKKAAMLAVSKKAFDIAILDLRKLTSMADFFVVCSTDSDTQARAVADAIRYGMEDIGEKPWHREGHSDAHWILLDFVTVVIHVFHKETRSFYNLEKLWGDAAFEYIEDKPSATTAFRRRVRSQRKVGS